MLVFLNHFKDICKLLICDKFSLSRILHAGNFSYLYVLHVRLND